MNVKAITFWAGIDTAHRKNGSILILIYNCPFMVIRFENVKI